MSTKSQTAADVCTFDITLSNIKLRKAGEAIVQGMPVYLKSSDSKYYKALNTDTQTALVAGIAVTPAAVDQFFLNQEGGFMDIGATGTVGEELYLNAVGGQLDDAKSGGGTIYSLVGFFDTTTKFKLVTAIGSNTSVVM